MSNMRWIPIFVIALFLPLKAMSGTFDGSQPVICAVTETHECGEGVECERGLAESINLPQFILIDFKKKTISGTLPKAGVSTGFAVSERCEKGSW